MKNKRCHFSHKE